MGEVTNFANDRAFKYVHGDQITDFQTGYEFSNRLQGLSLLFQINNMFNSPYIAYQRSESQQIDFQMYGRQLIVGVNYLKDCWPNPSLGPPPTKRRGSPPCNHMTIRTALLLATLRLRLAP